MTTTTTSTLNTRTLLDPTSELSPALRGRTARPSSLDGHTIGLLDLSKPRGDIFLDRLEALLAERGLRVVRFRKPTYTKPMPAALGAELRAQCDVVIEALAD
jgi:hypothetical protein